MRADTLQRLPGLKPELIPPEGSTPVGFMPGGDGRIIYERTILDRDTMIAAKEQATDENGKLVWVKHKTTGEPIYPRMKALVPVFKTEQFTLLASPRGHVSIQDYAPPSQEDKDRIRIKKRQADILEGLSLKGAELDMEVDEFINHLLTSVEERARDDEPYPRNRKGGWWDLSNGEKYQGKEKGALKAQAEIDDPVSDFALAAQVAEETEY